MGRTTKANRLILEHIETFGFITVRQCQNIIYKDNKCSDVRARKKLKEMFDKGYIKKQKNSITSEYIYTLKEESISRHKYILMNLYSVIYSKNKCIIYFRMEELWKGCNKKSDAHIIYQTYDNRKIGMLVEVDIFHFTTQDKLDKIYRSGDVEDWYKANFNSDYFPQILILNNKGKTKLESDDYDILCTSIDDLESIF